MPAAIRVALAVIVLVGAAAFGFSVVAEQLAQPRVEIAQANSDKGKKEPEKAPDKKAADKKAADKPASSDPAVSNIPTPAPEILLVMVRTALIALDQANKTNNYSVLYGLGGPDLRANSPEKLSEMFAGVRNAKVDLQPVVVLTPQITEAPRVGANGVLVLNGLFPSQPMQIRFQIAYQPADGIWKLAGINLSLVPVGPPPAAAMPSPTGAEKSDKKK